jgi:hypothetical protein
MDLFCDGLQSSFGNFNMMRNMLIAIAKMSRPLLKLLLSLFFDKKYLTGRYFDDRFDGYIWSFRSIWSKNILRLGMPLSWPSALTCYVSDSRKIFFHPDDLNNFQSPGTYFQNSKASIYLGRGVYIGPNVGIITANHNIHDLDLHHEGRDVVIGNRCWIGMNAVLLPGIVLGDRTIVAAGSVVTKSFPEGGCVIGGAPAIFLSKIDTSTTTQPASRL